MHFKVATILSLMLIVGLFRLEIFAMIYSAPYDLGNEDISEIMAHMENPVKTKKFKKAIQKQQKKIDKIIIKLDSTDLEPDIDSSLFMEPVRNPIHNIGNSDTASTSPAPFVAPDIPLEGPILIAQQMPLFGECSSEIRRDKFTACSNKEVLRYLAKHIKYPKEARVNNLEGMVIAEIVIDKEGAVTAPKVLRGIGLGCDEEVLRVLRQMPDWIPGRHNGRAVKVLMRIPVRFTLAK